MRSSRRTRSFAAFVAIHKAPEVGLCFNVILIFALFTIFLHNGEYPLNCSAASSALVGSKLISQAIQKICAHTKIIAARKTYTELRPSRHVPEGLGRPLRGEKMRMTIDFTQAVPTLANLPHFWQPKGSQGRPRRKSELRSVDSPRLLVMFCLILPLTYVDSSVSTLLTCNTSSYFADH